MKTSPRGIEDLVLSEALKTRAYRDDGGVLTIGVGHTSAAGPPKVTDGMTISRQEALDIFARDLAKFEAGVNAVLPNVPQHVFDGAVSFHFNTGGIKTASWPRSYKAGNMAAAEQSLKQWNKAGGRVLRGLINRRNFEADLIFRGKYRTKAAGEPVPPSVPASPVLRKGDGISANLHLRDKVAEAQTLLRTRGFDPGAADGRFGLGTEAKVIAFQRQRGLIADGVIGPATWAALRALNPASLVALPPRQPDDPGPTSTSGDVLGKTIQASVADAVDEVAADTSVPGLTKGDAGEVTGAVLDVLAANPKFVNATNSEAWWQSGVQYGGSTATLAAGFIVASFVRKNGFDFDAYLDPVFIPSLLATAGGIFTLIRRFVPGLKPMFSKGE